MSQNKFIRYELLGDALIWCDDKGNVVYRRSRSGFWYINESPYSFDTWLELVDLPDEEKVWLRLHFG